MWALSLVLALAHIGTAAAGTTPPGTVISNTASLSYQVAGGSPVTEQTNTVSITTVAKVRTPSSVAFFDYAPGSSAATGLLAGPTQCSTDGGSTFGPLANPNGLNVSQPLALAPTSMYNAGDPLFIQLTDYDQNVNPTVRDTVLVAVSVPSLHESVVLKLTETGVNTGTFVGYVPTSTSNASGCVLQVGANTTVDVNYTDPTDSSDKSAATALVDPYNVVFDSTSGKRLNGATLTLVDATTGQPVPVLGKDGISTYPSTVTSGTTVKDSAGETYDMPAGGFIFPMVKPGNYRVIVQTPAGYHSPSVVNASTLQTLSGAPYILPAASFGGSTALKSEGIFQFDMPLDPVSTTLLLQKTASTATASIGDIIQFTVTAENVSTTLAAEGVQVVDVLPQGLRYVKGSARLGNGTAADVSVSSTGQQLTINLGSVAAKSNQTVSYAVEITAATPLTTVINTAQAFEQGSAVSNQATAGVEVQSDFLQNVNTLVGRVVVGCDSQGKKGIENARVFMEDGSYAVTDKHGDYHFQAITNGTHVAQLDLASLPKGYEPMSCEQNTRWAGRDYSQFVEVHGGALWRADFHVRPIPGAEGDLSLQLSQAPASADVHNTVQLKVSDVPVTNLSTTVMLPEGMTYVAGSSRLDGLKIADPEDVGGGILVFRTGAHAAGWKGVIEFDTLLPAVQSATPPAAAHQTKSFTIEGFPSGKTQLDAHDREVMQQIADLVKGAQNVSMTFVGYTDDQPLVAGSRYANNMELSIARAEAVADYLQSHIKLSGAQIFISGRGSNEPAASNATAAGRTRNRRTEIEVVYDPKGTSAEPTAVNNTVFQTRALASFDAPSAKGQHTAPASVVLHALPGEKQEEREFTLRDFASGSATLSAHDQDVMRQVADLLQGAANVSLTFVGYTDDARVVAGSKYANNMELSIARAKTAADYVTAHLPVEGAQVFIVGRGSDATADGGDGDAADNRRIVIKVQYSAARAVAAEAGGQSAVQHAVVKGLSPADMVDATRQDAAEPPTATAGSGDDADKLADHFELDPKWLQTQADGKPQFIWPLESFLPAVPAIHVAVEHGAKQHAILSVNGEPVSSRAFLALNKNTQGTAAVSQWLGVPLREGDNDLVAEIMQGGKVVQRIERHIHYSGVPARAEFLAEQSKLLADGRIQPVFAVRFFDRWGYPARRGLTGKFQIGAPFQAYQSVQQLQQDQISAIGPREPAFTIGDDGVALIKLMPTTTTGEVTITVPLTDNTYQQLHGWMRPAARDWILVGVADGTAAFNKIKNNMQSVQGDDPNSDIYQDGRVAFYAKGTIKGGYLLTAAYDSAKAGGVGVNGLQQAVNPNTYFMLYGDSAEQGFDAQSASKLYVKIERDQFYALFGDFNTGLTVTDLSAYDRMFNGVKSAYQGDHIGYTAFAARNDQAYVKDEIQGNGTSGLYHLSHQQILINSERVELETRDRYTNAVVSTQSLTAFVDYTIDYYGGTIFFKEPVPARDSNFNPIYIVVQYEVSTGASNAITAGGRASIKSEDGRVELGATAVSEGTGNGNNRLTGLDLRVQVTPSTTLKAEVAHTANGPNGVSSTLSNVNGSSVTTGTTSTSNASGNAYSVDLKTQSVTLENDIYLKDEDPTFGLGQQSLGDAGMRRLGDNTRYQLDQSWSLVGNLMRQQSLALDVTSDVASGGVQYKFKSGDTLGIGVQHAKDSYPNLTPSVFGGNAQGDYSSNQVYLNGSYGVTQKVVLHGNVMTAAGGAADPQYPNLATAGVDYKLTNKTTLFLNEQSTTGAQQSDRTTEFGVKAQPWAHAQVGTSISQEQTEYGPRLFSTVGLTQGWQVNKDFSMQAGYNRVASLHQPNSPVTTADTATAPAVGTYTSNFNSLFLGASYHQDVWAMNGRFETLNSDQQTTRNVFAGFYRTLSAGTAFSAGLQAFHSDYRVGGISDNVDGRLGFAYRPDESRWSWLEQLDLIYASQQGLDGLPQFATATGTAASQESAASLANSPQTVTTYGLNMRNWKFVNNLQGNYTDPGRYQLSLYYGSKWARFTFDSGSYAGYTDLMGLEYRYDLRPNWDAGFMVNRIHSYSAGVINRSYGVETGWDVGTNMWLSVGYNFSGFYDQDFTASHYTAQGFYLRFRFKFDQDTVKSMASAGKVVTPP